jgi:hypothetical protein
MKTLQASIAFVLIITLGVFSQEEEEEEEGQSFLGVVSAARGVVVYSNIPEDFFTFELNGGKPEVFKKAGNYIVSLDGKGVQLNIVPLSAFLSPEETKMKNDSTVLLKHMNYEVNYFEEHIKTRLKVKSEFRKNKTGRRMLVWSFKMPKKSGVNVAMQLFISTVMKSHVLVLNGIIQNEKEYAAANKVLVNGINSLLTRDKAVDPEALEDSIKALK